MVEFMYKRNGLGGLWPKQNVHVALERGGVIRETRLGLAFGWVRPSY